LCKPTFNCDFFHNLFKDYTFYYGITSASKVGGVSIFVNNTCECNKNDEYNMMKNNDVTAENVWAQITKQIKIVTLKYTANSINIHPNATIDLFTDMLECELRNIRQSNIACIIAGDINTDLSKCNEHLCTTDYVNTLIASNFLPVIVMPTRITHITLLKR